MKIQKVKIKNFKSIDFHEVDLDGRNVFVIGPNAKGKTSFIQACFGEMPKAAIKEDQRNGVVTITLEDGHEVEFKLKKGKNGGTMNIFTPEGKEMKKPATVFKQLFGIRDFEIDKFLSLPMSKKVEYIKELIGIDFSDVDARYKELYDQRTFVKKQAEAVDGEIADRRFLTELPEEEVSIEELSKKIQIANIRNSQISSMVAKVGDLKKEKIQLLERLNEVQDKIEVGNKWFQDNPPIDDQILQVEFENLVEINAKIRQNNELGNLRDKSRQHWTEYEQIEKEMQEIKDLKVKQLTEAKFPVQGLSFDEDILLLDGLPFESDTINTARRIKAALELDFEKNKDSKVKIARFDGSLLDKNSMKEVEEWAEERGVQLFVELVDRESDQLKIEVQE